MTRRGTHIFSLHLIPKSLCHVSAHVFAAAEEPTPFPAGGEAKMDEEDLGPSGSGHCLHKTQYMFMGLEINDMYPCEI